MKRTIISNKEKLTPDDIAKGKNFGELMKNFQASPQAPNTPTSPTPKPFYKSGWFTGGMATLGVVVAITAGVILSGDKNTNNQTLADNENIQSELVRDTANSPFVNPPVPALDIQKDKYVVNAAKGGVVNHFTGTKITVPENAFTYKDGSPVEGDVEIQYREFHDQADIYFSGIPMEYDSAGKESIFESAGMMEILAFKDGERVEIATGKEFTICMHTKNPDPKFNLYHLDEENKEWAYEGKDSVTIEDEPTELADEFDGFTPQVKEQLKSEKLIVAKKEKEVAIIKNDVVNLKKKSPKKPTKVNDDKYSFNIDINTSEFPEIAQYKATVFEAVNQKTFDPKVYDVQWENISLEKRNEKGIYNVVLNRSGEKKEILVKPVFEGKNYKKALADFNKQFKVYETTLAKRKEDEAEAIADLEDKRNKYIALLEAKKTERKQTVLNAKKADKAMNRIFKINRVGTWNCDSPYYPGGSRVLAVFKYEGTNDYFNPASLRLIQKGLNAASPIRGNSVQYNKDRDNMLWGTDKDGNIVYAFNDQFRKINSYKNKATFSFKKVDPKGKTLKEIKKIIGC